MPLGYGKYIESGNVKKIAWHDNVNRNLPMSARYLPTCLTLLGYVAPMFSARLRIWYAYLKVIYP